MKRFTFIINKYFEYSYNTNKSIFIQTNEGITVNGRKYHFSE